MKKLLFVFLLSPLLSLGQEKKTTIKHADVVNIGDDGVKVDTTKPKVPKVDTSKTFIITLTEGEMTGLQRLIFTSSFPASTVTEFWENIILKKLSVIDPKKK